MLVVQLHPEHGSCKHRDHAAFHFDMFLHEAVKHLPPGSPGFCTRDGVPTPSETKAELGLSSPAECQGMPHSPVVVTCRSTRLDPRRVDVFRIQTFRLSPRVKIQSGNNSLVFGAANDPEDAVPGRMPGGTDLASPILSQRSRPGRRSLASVSSFRSDRDQRPDRGASCAVKSDSPQRAFADPALLDPCHASERAS